MSSSRIEVSYQPTRRRERQMRRIRAARHVWRFSSVHARIHNHVQLHRYRLNTVQR